MKLEQFFITIGLMIPVSIHAQDHSDTSRIQTLPTFNKQQTVFDLKDEQLTNENQFLRFYALSGYREGISPIKGSFGSNFFTQIDKINGTHQIKMFNLSIQDMLTHGLRKSSRVILEVKDPSRYRYVPQYGSEKDWLRKNAYCFEMLMPLGVVESLSKIDDQLCNLFKVKCRTEKRLVKTLVLVRTSDHLKFKTAGGDVIRDNENGIYQNTPMSALGDSWYQYGTLPFKDETNYRAPVDISLNLKVKSMEDLPSFRKALKKYDLDVKEEIREMEMFVITELN